MPEIDGVEVRLASDNSDPPVYENVSLNEPEFAAVWGQHDSSILREFRDPAWGPALAPIAKTESRYVLAKYGDGFRLDLIVHPGFDFCGWSALRFDIFIDGREMGYVLLKKERYRKQQNRAKLEVGGLSMMPRPVKRVQGKKKQPQDTEPRMVRLVFGNPTPYLGKAAANAGSVIVEVRLCNEDAGIIINANALCSFIFRYRNDADLMATGVWSQIAAEQGLSGDAEGLDMLKKLAGTPYRPQDAAMNSGNDKGSGANWVKDAKADESLKRKVDELDSSDLDTPSKKQNKAANDVLDPALAEDLKQETEPQE